MADWSNPTNATLHTDVLDELKARDEDLARLFNGGESNLPTNAVRLNRGTGQWENWNGSAWVALTIDVTKLNGQAASYYTNASNLSSGTIPNARFPATLSAASGVNLTSLNASNLGSGTVPDARFASSSVDLQGGFDSGQPIKLRKVGGIVQITSDGSLTHASATSRLSVNALPLAYRPKNGVTSTDYITWLQHASNASDGVFLRLAITENGLVRVRYFDSSGAAISRTDTGGPIAISYIAYDQ